MKASDLEKVRRLLDNLKELNEALTIRPRCGKGVSGDCYSPEDFPEVGRCIREMRRTVRRELRKLGVGELPAAETLLENPEELHDQVLDGDPPGTNWVNVYLCRKNHTYRISERTYGSKAGAQAASNCLDSEKYVTTISFNPYEK